MEHAGKLLSRFNQRHVNVLKVWFKKLMILLQPVKVRNWELQVQFKVSGSTKDLYGDGFAIWYTRDRMEGGDVFGSRDYFSGLAVIADTYSNHNGPHNVRF